MRITPFAVAVALSLAAIGSASALTVETKVSAEFQKKIDKDYGAREADILGAALAKRVETTFAREGVKADHVVVTIEDARPNRPTMQQISNKPGLDPIYSISTGGARLTGVAYDASGKEIGAYQYDWYETDLTNVVGAATWTDARTTFDRFARRFADKLS
jgi:hypothetical protein